MRLFTKFCITAALIVSSIYDPTYASTIKSPATYEKEFTSWMLEHGVSFSNALEHVKRLEQYIANDLFIEEHNEKYRAGDVKFTLGHNKFSHLSNEEFKNEATKGFVMPPNYLEERLASRIEGYGEAMTSTMDVPDSIDWVEKGGVTKVKNQGQCGSCWAFSTTGAVEGAVFVASGKLPDLSEQELVDCDHHQDHGCYGGLMDHAFSWIEKHPGLCTEEDYPYVAHKTKCKVCNAAVKVTGYQDVNAQDEEALKAAVAQQPVSVAIEADQREFQFYKSGIFDKECGTRLDHGVLVVGYGEDNGTKFWKVKNSWGPAWGDEGFIRLSRGEAGPNGQCGIAMVPSYPTASLVNNTAKTEELSATNTETVEVTGKSKITYIREFETWRKQHGLTFENAMVYLKRLETYIVNDIYIHLHNSEGKSTFTMGHNAFSHLSHDEFKQKMKNGFVMPPNYLAERLASRLTNLSAPKDVPDSIDWVEKGGVTPIKNQGQCGSCWAFSTTGAVEGAVFVSSGVLPDLSEQELVDCDKKGDNGCNGGLMDHAFAWIEDHPGLCSEEDYPYVAERQTCRTCEAKVRVTGYQDVNPQDEAALKAAVAQQPVSVAIEADQRAFQFYKSGVFDATCGTRLDHGVLVVGYGEEDGKKFWKVKNSWGPAWGDSGFIKLAREDPMSPNGESGQCGIAMAPSYPFATMIKPTSTSVASSLHTHAKHKSKKVSSPSINQCGSDALVTFEQLEITPSIPQRGKPVIASGVAKTKSSFKQATFELTVTLADVPLFEHEGSFCGSSHIPLPLGLGAIDIHGFACPASKGTENKLQMDVNLPTIAPSGNYVVKLVSRTEQDKKELLCVHVALDLNNDKTSEKSSVYEYLDLQGM